MNPLHLQHGEISHRTGNQWNGNTQQWMRPAAWEQANASAQRLDESAAPTAYLQHGDMQLSTGNRWDAARSQWIDAATWFEQHITTEAIVPASAAHFHGPVLAASNELPAPTPAPVHEPRSPIWRDQRAYIDATATPARRSSDRHFVSLAINPFINAIPRGETYFQAFYAARASEIPADSLLGMAEAARHALAGALDEARADLRLVETALNAIQMRLDQAESDPDSDPLLIATDRVRIEQLGKKQAHARSRVEMLAVAHAQHEALGLREEYADLCGQLAALANPDDLATCGMTVAHARERASEWRARLAVLTGHQAAPIVWEI